MIFVSIQILMFNIRKLVVYLKDFSQKLKNSFYLPEEPFQRGKESDIEKVGKDFRTVIEAVKNQNLKEEQTKNL